jgi:hypothetical protein
MSSPNVETKLVVLELSVSLDEALTETEITDMCSAMVSDIAAEASIDAADVLCVMTAHDAAARARQLLATTFDYNVVLTLTIPAADGDVPVEVAEELVASIKLLPELEGGSVALASITDGEKSVVHTTLPSSAARVTLPLCAALCVLVVFGY